jgi:5-methylcytosine-specific restriction enzyme A
MVMRSNQKTYVKQIPKVKSTESWGVNRGGKFYDTPFWKGRRKWFREQPGNQLCAMCKEAGITKSGWVVDHIIPVPAGADFETFVRYSNESNLQFLCEAHHNQKTNKENR